MLKLFCPRHRPEERQAAAASLTAPSGKADSSVHSLSSSLRCCACRATSSLGVSGLCLWLCHTRSKGVYLFSRYFRVLPALDAGDRRGSLVGLPYCCSAGLTLANVVGEPNCCSVVTVNTSNTVQLLTFDSSNFLPLRSPFSVYDT